MGEILKLVFFLIFLYVCAVSPHNFLFQGLGVARLYMLCKPEGSAKLALNNSSSVATASKSLLIAKLTFEHASELLPARKSQIISAGQDEPAAQAGILLADLPRYDQYCWKAVLFCSNATVTLCHQEAPKGSESAIGTWAP